MTTWGHVVMWCMVPQPRAELWSLPVYYSQQRHNVEQAMRNCRSTRLLQSETELALRDATLFHQPGNCLIPHGQKQGFQPSSLLGSLLC